MSIINRLIKQQPPPPEPIYKKQPIATAAVILTIIGMFVLTPIGVIYKSLSEEVKEKADYDTVIQLMKSQKERDDLQWKAIERLIQSTQMIQAPKKAIKQSIKKTEKRSLTPEEFQVYMSMDPELRVQYKKYLISKGCDVEGLPE